MKMGVGHFVDAVVSLWAQKFQEMVEQAWIVASRETSSGSWLRQVQASRVHRIRFRRLCAGVCTVCIANRKPC
jgi:hypothetical protein